MAQNVLDYIINLRDGTFGRNMSRAQSQTTRLDNMFGKLTRTFLGYVTVQQSFQFIKGATEAHAELEALDVRLQTVAQSQEKFAAYNNFINKTINDLALPLKTTKDSFSAFTAATRGTRLEGEQTAKIFKGLATASRALKLPNENMARIFRSVEQMMSKGVVMSEELKLQLGDAMPGALQAAAASMNMTTSEFMKNMEKGLVRADEFLPRFAQHLENLYGPGVAKAMDSTQAKLVGIDNQILQMTANIGTQAAPIYLEFLRLKMEGLKILQKLFVWYDKNRDIINKVGKQLLIVTGVMFTVIKVIALVRNAWILFNLAFSATPIGAIIAAIGLLIGVAVWAYTEFDEFRAVIDGLVETAVKGFDAIWRQLKLLMTPIRLVVAFLSGGKEGFLNELENVKNDAIKFGEDISDVYSGQAFMRGYDRSMEKSKKIAPDKLDNILKGVKVPGQEGEDPWAAFGGSGKGVPGSGVKGIDTSVGSGRTTRNVTVTIQNVIREFNVNTTTVREKVDDIKRMVQDSMNRVILDAQSAM